MDKVSVLEKQLGMYMRMNKVMKKEIDQTYQQGLTQKQTEIGLSRNLSRQKSDLGQKLEMTVNENHEYKRRCATANIKIDEKNKELEDIKRQLFTSSTTNNQLEKANIKLTDDLKKLTMEFTILQREKHDVDKKLLQVKAVNTQDQKIKANLNAEISKLSAQLETSSSKRRQLSNTLISKNEQLSKQAIEISSFKKDHLPKIKALNKTIEDQKKELLKTTQKYDNLIIKHKEDIFRLNTTKSKHHQRSALTELEKSSGHNLDSLNDIVDSTLCYLAAASKDLELTIDSHNGTLEGKMEACNACCAAVLKKVCSQKEALNELNEKLRLKRIECQNLSQENRDFKDKIALKEEMEIQYVQSIKQLSREQ
eukprot:NODE_311_length_11244_cov_0.423419.p2 type:complete len:367 gc:universal NODE_311_length_11244_cov_0.423419:8580-9680(+)